MTKDHDVTGEGCVRGVFCGHTETSQWMTGQMKEQGWGWRHGDGAWLSSSMIRNTCPGFGCPHGKRGMMLTIQLRGFCKDQVKQDTDVLAGGWYVGCRQSS